MKQKIKMPKRGDTVFVPNEPNGKWIGGIVNSVDKNGEMLVGVRGHYMGASMVIARKYLDDWCYPGDIGKTSVRSERLIEQ